MSEYVCVCGTWPILAHILPPMALLSTCLLDKLNLPDTDRLPLPQGSPPDWGGRASRPAAVAPKSLSNYHQLWLQTDFSVRPTDRQPLFNWRMRRTNFYPSQQHSLGEGFLANRCLLSEWSSERLAWVSLNLRVYIFTCQQMSVNVLVCRGSQ